MAISKGNRPFFKLTYWHVLSCLFKVVMSKIWVTLFLKAPLLKSCDCGRAFGRHLPEFMRKPNGLNCMTSVDRLFPFFRTLTFLFLWTYTWTVSPGWCIFFVRWFVIVTNLFIKHIWQKTRLPKCYTVNKNNVIKNPNIICNIQYMTTKAHKKHNSHDGLKAKV